MPIAGGKEDVVVPSVVLFVFGIVAVETGCRIVVVVTDCRFRGRLSVSACCYQFFFFFSSLSIDRAQAILGRLCQGENRHLSCHDGGRSDHLDFVALGAEKKHDAASLCISKSPWARSSLPCCLSRASCSKASRKCLSRSIWYW